jgi:acyl carrier protein
VSVPEVSGGQAEAADRIRVFVASALLLDPTARVDGDTPLLRGLIDSTGLMELLSFVEDEFGVPVEHTDIDEENFGSVDRIARFVARASR